MHTPDNWVIIKIKLTDETFYKVLAGWSGGYLDGDSWRLNSGITKVEFGECNEVETKGDYIDFIGNSGSVYRCHKESEGLRMNCAYIWERMKKTHPDMVELIEYKDFMKEFKMRDRPIC